MIDEKNIYPYFEDYACIAQVRDVAGDEPGGKKAEAELYKLLKEQLPDNWYFIYDVGFRGVDGDNQIDFMVIVPGKGIINLECKGTGYTPLEKGAKFNHEFFNSPRNLIEKARKAIENRYKTICLCWQRDHIAVFSKAIIFPTVDFYDDKGELFDFELNPVYTKKDIAIDWDKNGPSPLEKIILKCFDADEKNITKGRNFKIAQLSKDDAQRIFDTYKATGKEVLGTIFNNELKLFSDKLENTSVARSFEPLDYIFSDGPYKHIYGAAGTGKTWLAQMAIERFLELDNLKEARVLYVCYNTMLAADLAANRFAKYPEKNVCVTNFHRLDQVLFSKSCCIQTNNQFDESATDKKFQDTWNALSVDDRKKKKFDLILVDEAQDFNKAKVDFICSIAKSKNRKIVFFSDKEQAMRDYACTEKWTPNALVGENGFELKYNLRNSFQIHSWVEDELIKTGSSGLTCQQGPAPEITKSDLGFVNTELKKVFKTYPASTIAVISDLQEDEIKKMLPDVKFLTKGKNFSETKKNLANWRKPDNDRYIWLSTIKKFKGLEADVVLVILSQDNIPTAVKYVAATRAKYCLKIFLGN